MMPRNPHRAESEAFFERWCERLSANDAASFDDLASASSATLVIGTAPGEWVTERDRLRFGFEAEGVRLEPKSPRGYEEGALDWFVDEPKFHLPDNSFMQTRVTGVLRREDDRWKVVHMHISVGVPDEEVVELQKRWS